MTQEKKKALKKIIDKLHEGADPEELKREFKETIGSATPTEISVVEEELVREGLPREKLLKLCDVHLAVFRESIEGKGDIAPAGHPIFILMHEHQAQLDMIEELSGLTRQITSQKRDPTAEEHSRIIEIVDNFKEAENHYLREENVLFPYLEKHGIREPPAVMWMEHDQIRAIKKRLFASIDKSKIDINGLFGAAILLHEMLAEHFYKENNILFPTSMNLLTEDEWTEILEQFEEIGYCCFTPEVPKSERATTESLEADITDGEVKFESGTLRVDILEAILNTLPIDITFVDAEDRVRYFSLSSERIFVRSKAVIGREVQYCHPKKSLDKVNKILDDFRQGLRDSAEFWINLGGRLVYIRYFAVRSKNGEYLGTLEVTQDITDIKKIQGEKRLDDEPRMMPTV